MTDAHTTIGYGEGPFSADELAALYAAGALSADEAAAFESRVRAGEEACVTALRNVTPAMESLLNSASEIAPPSRVLGGLMARIDAEAADVPDAAPSRLAPSEWAEAPEVQADAEPLAAGATSEGMAAGIAVFRASSAKWHRTGLPGVRMRTLFADRRANRRTIMLDMAPGSALPDHEHAGVEEVFLISGDLAIAGTTLHAGDYIKINEGAEHGVPVTPSGCVCIVISNYVPFPLTSMLGFVWSALRALFKRTSPRDNA